MDKKDFLENNESDGLEDILSELETEPQEEPLPEEPEAEEQPTEEELCEETPVPRRRRRWPWVVGGIALFLALVAALGFYAYGEARDLADVAFAVLDEAEDAVDYAKDGDVESLAKTMASIDAKLDGIDTSLDKPLWKLAAKVPGPGGDITRLRALFGIWDRAYGSVITPALSTLRSYPLPDLKDPDVKALLKEPDMLEAYVRLALEVLPECERCMDDFCAIPSLWIPQLEEKMAELRSLIGEVKPVLPLAEDLLANAALPAVETLKIAPPTELLSSNESFEYIINVRAVMAYLKLAEQLVPRAEGWLEEIENLPLPSEELDEKVDGLSGKVRELLPLYSKAEKYIPLAKAFFDCEEDRQYILAIQNNTEIRASGGFPGNMGLLYLEDGKLYVSSFMAVFDVLSRYVDFKDTTVTPTQTELQIFYEFPYAPRDAVINPHFPRVAEIWCKSPHKGLKPSQGVISISPTLVQDFLSVMEAEVELSDGTVLDSGNATRYLQHELYMKYFNNWYQDVYTNNDECDAMFAEAAKAVLKMVTSELDLDKIPALLDVVDKQIEERKMLFWLEDPAGQAIIEELGAAGSLNSDPEKPELGVYYSGTVSSKLGWYLNMDVDVGEGRKNGNAMTYPVTITMENTLTWEEFSTTSAWVVGTCVGSSNPYIFVFAPAGGTVENFTVSNGTIMVPATYQGLDLGYQTWVNFPLGETLVITCDVTTAPGVDAPLGLDMTPTLQEYREAA